MPLASQPLEDTAASIRAMLPAKPLRVYTHFTDNQLAHTRHIHYVEMTYPDFDLARLEPVALRFLELHELREYKSRPYTAHGVWVSLDRPSRCRLEVRRYAGTVPTIRVTVAELILPKR